MIVANCVVIMQVDFIFYICYGCYIASYPGSDAKLSIANVNLYSTDPRWSQEDMDTMLYGLASRFYGITMLWPFQLEAATAALRDRDSIIVQPTGCGKSLCYQLVSLHSKKMVSVFKPTVALMYDQVRQLQNRGIPTIALGGWLYTTTGSSNTRIQHYSHQYSDYQKLCFAIC